MWEYKIYKKWDKLPWIMPMIAWEEILQYEEKNIFIQYYYELNRKTLWLDVVITHIESLNPWSWNFDKVLWNFIYWIQKIRKPDAKAKFSISNLLNKWLVKYMEKYKINIK